MIEANGGHPDAADPTNESPPPLGESRMTPLADRIAGLTPEQRELLLRRLAGPANAPAAPAGHVIRPRAERNGTAPTSRGQENLWLLDRMDPGSTSGNIGYPVRLR